MNAIEIGKLLRSGISGFAVGCKVSAFEVMSRPLFSALVRAPLGGNLKIFGLIYDINIDDDGLVRQLVTADGINNTVIEDNRINRNVPLEISVLTVGYANGDQIFHLLPPKIPLSLDTIQFCTPSELCAFTGLPRFGYFRHILRNSDLPISEIIASHLQQANQAHIDNQEPNWLERATQELITLLRDDYPTLMAVLGALSDAIPQEIPI